MKKINRLETNCCCRRTKFVRKPVVEVSDRNPPSGLGKNCPTFSFISPRFSVFGLRKIGQGNILNNKRFVFLRRKENESCRKISEKKNKIFRQKFASVYLGLNGGYGIPRFSRGRWGGMCGGEGRKAGGGDARGGSQHPCPCFCSARQSAVRFLRQNTLGLFTDEFELFFTCFWEKCCLFFCCDFRSFRPRRPFSRRLRPRMKIDFSGIDSIWD